MSLVLRGVVWFGLYLLLVLAPLGVALVTAGETSLATPLTGIACALGLAAFAVIAVEFALVSRLRSASEPFGTDALMQFHRLMGIGAVIAAAAHALPFAWRSPALLNPFDPRSPAVTGAAAFWVLLAVVVSSIYRRRLRISYETWQFGHGVGALLIVTGSFAHALRLGSYSAATPLRWVLSAFVAAFVLLLLRYRLVRPWLLRHRPWEVLASVDEGASTRRLRLRPVGHRGFDFLPGQFAWLSTARSPLSMAQHPLSLASSAVRPEDGSIEFSVKALGDWSGEKVPALRPGDRAWVDGPYGAFSMDRTPALGFVMISGGSGIAPMRSMLLTMRDRGDPRRVVLIHGANRPERMAHRAELEALAGEMNLQFVPVYEQPPPGWAGEIGYVTAEVLRRWLPPQRNQFQYFICGPGPMMDVVEAGLLALGVEAGRIHTERFDMV